MEPFTNVRGAAAPMLSANIDTDVIMPKQFLKGIDRSGLDKGVFHDLRFLPDGRKNPDFVLNQAPWYDAKFLVVGPNFGCGSSREHAVWGLRQLGIRALIGSSFAGIFFDNCKRNGVLLIELTQEQVGGVGKSVSEEDAAVIEIDLPAQKISLADGTTLDFAIDGLRKDALVSGLDAIGGTLKLSDEIEQFERRHFAARPWLS
ncbi:3-isopropylmalate dehydratase small subunit 1 [Alloalcanivorax dieselolei B5]|uniref:3-isopropylmalate dehydratase small subunit n=1 Tax=Alcanivorax dieselolei (strain DSM 16502 / CGMCC 1.3690 / MCCC 1A00001 / B-5) TaxID=930169 RepID=K0CFD2_ALCDB|nr:3-isopropylmalate dehydratase small subunit [Alloalcanivorax dieselolei]AFT71358.1 3-isopropylmalate dehydratase small subunit 1 [Alloalcanivorax dieselolei B5]GGJ95079.1 3-isopropylmalate dehydratase small subunit [Alloalcanivorax dieselolei]